MSKKSPGQKVAKGEEGAKNNGDSIKRQKKCT